MLQFFFFYNNENTIFYSLYKQYVNLKILKVMKNRTSSKSVILKSVFATSALINGYFDTRPLLSCNLLDRKDFEIILLTILSILLFQNIEVIFLRFSQKSIYTFS